MSLHLARLWRRPQVILPPIFVSLSIILWILARSKEPISIQLLVLTLILLAWPLGFVFESIWRGARSSLRLRRQAPVIPWKYRVPTGVPGSANFERAIRESLNAHLAHVAEEDRPRVALAWSMALQRQEVIEVEYRRNTQSDKTEWMLDVGQMVQDSAGRSQFVAGVSLDITKRKQAEQILWTAKERAEFANRTKSEFLAHMSHEIRTPLAAILGFCEVLSDDHLTEHDRLDAVGIIKRNGELLCQIVNNILDLSKIEAGRLEVEMIEVDVRELVREVARLFDAATRKKGLDLVCNLVEPLPHQVVTDPTRLKQILINIIGNAVKFTDRGKVEISMRATDGEHDGRPTSRFSFTIADTGPGFTEAQRTRIFKNYGQAEEATSRKFGGTGLGLVLSRKLAAMLQGSVELIDTRPGQGSTFLVVIEAQRTRV